MDRHALDPHTVLSHGWFVSAPNAVLSVQVAFAAASLFLFVQVIRWSVQSAPANPFTAAEGRLSDRREAALKQDFQPDKLPHELDAIVIGSGYSGLTTAALLAKTGRRVLVLEQHDQAGGNCHTGNEFDMDIHCAGGDVACDGQLGKFLLDQVSDCQIQFAQMSRRDSNLRVFAVLVGLEKWRAELESQFPGESPAISGFFQLLAETKNAATWLVMLKVFPLWLSQLLINTKIIHLFTNLWRSKFLKSTKELIGELTDNKDLQTALSYNGTSPSQSHFLIHSLILHHYSNGAFYPTKGASEIAISIIPVIEKTGGRVLVNAAVEEILHNGKKVMGVAVRKGNHSYRIEAPMVVSSVGIKNTFQKLLPAKVAKQSYFYDLCSQIQSGYVDNPLVVAKSRPKTDVEGLYLTGQDVLTSGFAGALYSGLLTASAILGRNLFRDLTNSWKSAKLNKKKFE